MRFHASLLALLTAQSVSGAALYGGVLTAKELVEGLIQRPNLLPESSQRMLLARAQELNRSLSLSKRTPQSPTTLAPISGMDVFVMLLQSVAGKVTQNTPGKVAPPSKVPDVSDSESIYRHEYPGAKRRKIRYGPYRVPSNKEKNLESTVLFQQGLTNTLKTAARRPCEGNCMVLEISAGLETDDGSNADVANGAWLHHVVLINVGKTVKEPICNSSFMEIIFMSSKERSEALFLLPNSSVKTAYHLEPEDSLVLSTELFNMDDREKWLWVTVNYDYIDGENTEYKDGKMVWMTIGRSLCRHNFDNPFGESNMTMFAQPLRMAFSEHSIPWDIPYNAQLLGSNGHMHDGAASMDIFHDGKLVCTSTPKYGKAASQGMGGGGMAAGGGMAGGGGHSHGRRDLQPIVAGNYSNTEIEHILQQAPCIHEPPLKVTKGGKMFLAANYDFHKHPGMKNDKGELDKIMGIAGMIFALPYPRN